jgi:putative N6-adenine-specific DNA methylase
VVAPLRETLAAALVTLSRYRGGDPFCDPFCGSGTIPIEAALIAKNRAPGLDRSFAAQRWKNLDSALWADAAQEAMDKEFHGAYDIWGGDIDPAAVELSRHNAELAGVEDCVRFEVADAGQFHRESEYGQVVTNPPYGERLLDKQQAEALYRSFGAACRTLPPKWRLVVLSSHTEFERCFGREADKRRKLYNGMLKCDAFLYGK